MPPADCDQCRVKRCELRARPAPRHDCFRLKHRSDLAGVPGGGFDIDPFEANKAIKLTDYVVTIGPGGFVDVPVTLTITEPEGGYNYFVAAIQDAQDAPAALSPKIILKLQNALSSLVRQPSKHCYQR